MILWSNKANTFVHQRAQKGLKHDPFQLKISDSAEGPSGGTGGPPVTKLAVLPRPHKVLAPTVIGVLVQSPVAVHHVAGVDVMTVEMILHRITVVAELHHLSLEVGAPVDAEAVGALTGLRTHSELNSHSYPTKHIKNVMVGNKDLLHFITSFV